MKKQEIINKINNLTYIDMDFIKGNFVDITKHFKAVDNGEYILVAVPDNQRVMHFSEDCTDFELDLDLNPNKELGQFFDANKGIEYDWYNESYICVYSA